MQTCDGPLLLFHLRLNSQAFADPNHQHCSDNDLKQRMTEGKAPNDTRQIP